MVLVTLLLGTTGELRTPTVDGYVPCSSLHPVVGYRQHELSKLLVVGVSRNADLSVQLRCLSRYGWIRLRLVLLDPVSCRFPKTDEFVAAGDPFGALAGS